MMVCNQSPGDSVIYIFFILDKAASATAYSVRIIVVVTAPVNSLPGQCGKNRGGNSPLPVLLHVLHFFWAFSFLESQFRGYESHSPLICKHPSDPQSVTN